MFTLVEALNYRSLRYVRRPLDDFHVLVGPNASGKSTFLDVFRFLGDVVQPRGVGTAINERSSDWRDLVWMQEADRFEFGIEATIPDRLVEGADGTCSHSQYQIRIGQSDPDPVGSTSELLELTAARKSTDRRWKGNGDPGDTLPPPTIFRHQASSEKSRVLYREDDGHTTFSSERGGSGLAYDLKPYATALANLPEDESQYPVSTWLKRQLADGITFLHLDADALSAPSPRGKQKQSLASDGSNLPWLVRRLKEEHSERFRKWIRHLQTALRDLKDVGTVVREEDGHCYLKAEYRSGAVVPSWGLSEGTLRMFALTILAYLPDVEGLLLIEEPENGIHPRALETVYESLSSVYDAQVLVATHSPIFVGCAEPEELLCFSMEDGQTRIISGDEHPRLSEWQRETDLGTLFAGGVLS
jgi:predicted ATPase